MVLGSLRLETFLLTIANEFRARDDQLVELPKGIIKSPYRCLIANALNNNCMIDPSPDGGFIYFESEDDLNRYLSLTDARRDYSSSEEEDNEEFCATLEPNLNRIALEFDKGLHPEYTL